MHKHKVGVSISDYTEEVDYKERLGLFCEQLEKYGITYNKNTGIDWFDFGFPGDTYHYQDEDAAAHMQSCNTVCHILDDGKIFYCGTAWAACKAGLFQMHENDHVDLKNMDVKDLGAKKELLELCLGNIENGYIEFCKVCGGYGNDNKNKVPAGRQLA